LLQAIPVLEYAETVAAIGAEQAEAGFENVEEALGAQVWGAQSIGGLPAVLAVEVEAEAKVH